MLLSHEYTCSPVSIMGVAYIIGQPLTDECTCIFIMSPCPWDEGGHLDLLWFPITQMCFSVLLHPSVPEFAYMIFRTGFPQ